MKPLRFCILLTLACFVLLAPQAATVPEAHASPSALTLQLVSTAGGTSAAVAVQGNYAYLGEGYRLAVLNLSNPGAPALVGRSMPIPDRIQGITLSGSLAYVAAKSAGLVILDVSDPQHPAVLGSADTPGEAAEVVLAGSYALVADGSAGLTVVDISAPQSPHVVGGLDTPGQARGVAVAGAYAYVADGDTARIVDISVPTSPSARGFYPPSPPGWTVSYLGIAAAGSYVYTSDGYELQVLDVSNPAAPILAGSTALVSGPYAIALAGDYAYLAIARGVLAVNISDPAKPTGGGSHSCSACWPAVDLTVAGSHVVAATGFGLSVYGLADPAAPAELGIYESTGTVGDLRLAGRHAFAAMGEQGLGVFDTTDLRDLGLVGRLDTPGYAANLAVAGTTAIVGDGWGLNLRFVDISAPTAPRLLANFPAPGGGGDVEVQGSYAYVVDGGYGLRILDISDPAQPRQVGILTTLPDWPVGLAVAGNYAYVADGSKGLRVVQVSDPAAPTVVGFYDPFSPAQSSAVDVTIAGDLAYIAYSYRGVRIVNIADPAHPTFVGSLATTPASACDIAVTGGVAVVGTDRSVLLVDVRDPTHPAILDTYPTGDAVGGLALRGDVVLVANKGAGITILRIVGFLKSYLPLILRP